MRARHPGAEPAAEPAIELAAEPAAGTAAGTGGGPLSEPAAGRTGDAAARPIHAPGAPSFDPVRQRFLEALARRTARLPASQAPAKALLENRLATSRVGYERDQAAARAAAGRDLADLVTRFPASADRLRGCAAAGDLAALTRLGDELAAPPAGGLLGALLADMASSHRQLTGGDVGGAAAADDGAAAAATAATAVTTADDARPTELRAVRRARSTWMRLRVDQQLAQSRAKRPDNPGPLNSHWLVLRGLQRLQALSPAYLAHLLAQLDTLRWLDPTGSTSAREPRQKR